MGLRKTRSGGHSHAAFQNRRRNYDSIRSHVDGNSPWDRFVFTV